MFRRYRACLRRDRYNIKEDFHSCPSYSDENTGLLNDYNLSNISQDLSQSRQK